MVQQKMMFVGRGRTKKKERKKMVFTLRVKLDAKAEGAFYTINCQRHEKYCCSLNTNLCGAVLISINHSSTAAE